LENKTKKTDLMLKDIKKGNLENKKNENQTIIHLSIKISKKESNCDTLVVTGLQVNVLKELLCKEFESIHSSLHKQGEAKY
jgi:hypothetical protein